MPITYDGDLTSYTGTYSGITGKGILDLFESAITDNTDELRSKALKWLNAILKRLATERDWRFMQKSATIDITSGIATLPADIKKTIYIENVTDGWFLTEQNRLSQQQVFALQNQTAETPSGYVENGVSLLFYPSGIASDSCTITYVPVIANVADDDTPTIYPIEAQVCIHRFMLASFYEYDFDERSPAAASAAAIELRNLKHWDNRQKPLPQYFTATTVTNYAP